MDRGLHELFTAFHPRILLIASRLHERIYQLNPDVRLDANVQFKLLHYRLPGDTKPFCSIELHKGVVKLHFQQGALLDDPAGLLKGSGKARRVILNTAAQAGAVPIRCLINQAIGLRRLPAGPFTTTNLADQELTARAAEG